MFMSEMCFRYKNILKITIEANMSRRAPVVARINHREVYGNVTRIRINIRHKHMSTLRQTYTYITSLGFRPLLKFKNVLEYSRTF